MSALSEEMYAHPRCEPWEDGQEFYADVDVQGVALDYQPGGIVTITDRPVGGRQGIVAAVRAPWAMLAGALQKLLMAQGPFPVVVKLRVVDGRLLLVDFMRLDGGKLHAETSERRG